MERPQPIEPPGPVEPERPQPIEPPGPVEADE